MNYESQASKLAEATQCMAAASTSLGAALKQSQSNEDLEMLVDLLRELEQNVADLKDAISRLKEAVLVMHPTLAGGSEAVASGSA